MVEKTKCGDMPTQAAEGGEGLGEVEGVGRVEDKGEESAEAKEETRWKEVTEALEVMGLEMDLMGWGVAMVVVMAKVSALSQTSRCHFHRLRNPRKSRLTPPRATGKGREKENGAAQVA